MTLAHFAISSRIRSDDCSGVVARALNPNLLAVDQAAAKVASVRADFANLKTNQLLDKLVEPATRASN